MLEVEEGFGEGICANGFDFPRTPKRRDARLMTTTQRNDDDGNSVYSHLFASDSSDVQREERRDNAAGVIEHPNRFAVSSCGRSESFW